MTHSGLYSWNQELLMNRILGDSLLSKGEALMCGNSGYDHAMTDLYSECNNWLPARHAMTDPYTTWDK